jgi:ABC-type transport system involved in multi-copper enzyme maturation permease subunit
MELATLTIARLTFREAARRRILLAALLLGVVFLIIFGIGYHFILRDFENNPRMNNPLRLDQIRNVLMMMGLYVVNFLTAIMTVLTSVDTISGEITSGTIHTLVSKPVSRWEILAGKWLGFAGMLTLYLILMGGGVMAILFLLSGYTAPNALRGLSLLWLNALLLLTISILGGTFLSTLANGVLVFGLFGVSFIGGWIEQIGTFFQSQAARTAVDIGIITSLILPSDALWRRAAYELQSPLMAAFGFSPFASTSVPSLIMITYALLYLLAALALAVHQFQKRDL